MVVARAGKKHLVKNGQHVRHMESFEREEPLEDDPEEDPIFADFEIRRVADALDDEGLNLAYPSLDEMTGRQLRFLFAIGAIGRARANVKAMGGSKAPGATVKAGEIMQQQVALHKQEKQATLQWAKSNPDWSKMSKAGQHFELGRARLAARASTKAIGKSQDIEKGVSRVSFLSMIRSGTRRGPVAFKSGMEFK